MSQTELSSHRIQPPTPIAILGVPFDRVTTAQTVALISQMIASRQPHYLATANVDFLVQALEDVELRRILLEAHLILCDGTPLVWASRWLGNPLPERVAGSDIVPVLLGVAAEKGWRVFFLGGKEEIILRALEKVKAQHPDLQVAGYLSPPFAPLLEMDHAGIARVIREARPDILLVSFGCPKQEKWIAMNYFQLGVPVSVGVGGTIDFLAGAIPRAPMWMRRSGLEWIFRLSQEPRRLLRRYLVDLRVFLWALFKQWWQLQARRRACRERAAVVAERAGANFEMVKVPARLDAAMVGESEGLWNYLTAAPAHLLLDMAGVEFVDSTGMGLLLRLHKHLAAAQRQLVLVAPSPAVKRALDLMRLGSVLATAPTLEAAQDLAADSAHRRAAVARLDLSAGPQPLKWQGDIVAANATAVWHLTEAVVNHCATKNHACVIDLAAVDFADSSGVGLMVRAKKLGRLHNVQVNFTNPQPNVLNVVRMLRMEQFLFGEPK